MRTRVQRGDIRPGDLPSFPQLVFGFGFFGACPIAGIYGMYIGLREGSVFWALLGVAMAVGGSWVLVKLIRAHIEILRVIRELYGDDRSQ